MYVSLSVFQKWSAKSDPAEEVPFLAGWCPLHWWSDVCSISTIIPRLTLRERLGKGNLILVAFPSYVVLIRHSEYLNYSVLTLSTKILH